MQLSYDDDFIEGAVFVAASGKRPGVPSSQIRRFHQERDRCYDVLDPDDRNTAFFKLHLAWFRRWELEKLLLDLLDEYPLLPSALTTLAFRKARSKKDESAELYVSTESGRSAIAAMRPERFGCDEAVAGLLRHEFTHLSDMVDPAFGYSPTFSRPGVNPTRQNIVRERYRLLWDITIDGRLHRSEHQRQHRALFDAVFHGWSESRRDDVFTRLWGETKPSHDQLMSLAADPRDQLRSAGPSPGAACPLCGFSTFQWAPVPDADIRASIQSEFQQWLPEHGVCERCAEAYAVANARAADLPP